MTSVIERLTNLLLQLISSKETASITFTAIDDAHHQVLIYINLVPEYGG
jgi:hypothetical protein